MSQFDEVIPESTRHFVRTFARLLLSTTQTGELAQLYQYEFNKQTERMYKTSTWPTIESLSASFPQRDASLLIDQASQQNTPAGLLYRELYFRHVYTRMVPTLDDRFDSFQNYIDLFNTLLGLDEAQPELVLPTVYCYDLVHNFISQFIEFHTYRNAVDQLSNDDISTLRDSGVHLWSAQTVLRYLHAFVRKSGMEQGSDASDVHQQFKIFGQFASIGLCRVNVALCDYQTALIALDAITLPGDLRKKSLITSVPQCAATLYTAIATALLYTARYTDAQKIALLYLTYIAKNKSLLQLDDAKTNIRNRGQQSNALTAIQVEAIQHNINQLYGIVAVCCVILNNDSNIDETHQTELKDRFSDTIQRLRQSNDVNLFDTLFQAIALSCITVSLPDYSSSSNNSNHTLYQQQQQVIYDQVISYTSLQVLISYLKLFTTVSLDKLAVFLSTNAEDVLAQLLKLKNKYTLLKHTPGTPISQGKYVDSCDVQYTINGTVVYVAEHVAERRYSDWFLKSVGKLHDVNRELARIGKAV